AACKRLVDAALDEDLGDDDAGGRLGDATSLAVIPETLPGRAVFVARSGGVLSGMHAAKLVLHAVEPHLQLQTFKEDGEEVQPGDRLAVVAGPMRGILMAERTALNFLQHLSGIASLTRKYVDAVAGLGCKILDTRKTLPGWRLLEKYAVRSGGGSNHRMGLLDGILIKDNHLAALRRDLASVAAAVTAALGEARHNVWVEVEVESLDQLAQALACRPNMILLDNM